MNKLVLRSINLPTQLDEILRAIAFHTRSTKSEVMRKMLEDGVEGYRTDLERWAPHLLPPASEVSKARPSVNK